MSRLYIAYRPVTPLPVVTYEPETELYLNALGWANDGTSTVHGVTQADIWTLVDALFVGIKTELGLPLGVNNLSTVSRFIQLTLGGDATKHRLNSIDGTNNLTFLGGWTHAANGMLPNGTNGYAETAFGYDGNSFIRDSQTFGIHIKTDTTGVKADFGVIDGGFANVLQYTRNGSNFTTRLGDQTNNTGTNTNRIGRYFINRTAGANYKQYKNGTPFNTVTQASNAFTTLTPKKLTLGAVNNGGTAIQFTDARITLFYHFDGLTDTQVTNIDNLFLTFETSIGR